MLSVKEYLDMIRQYLSDITNNHKTQNEWKIQLSLTINFVSSKDFKETRTIYTNSDNTDIIIGYETDQIIEEFFNSLLQRYQKGLKEFVFDSVDLLNYKLHKIILDLGGSHINSPEWLKNKKATSQLLLTLFSWNHAYVRLFHVMSSYVIIFQSRCRMIIKFS